MAERRMFAKTIVLSDEFLDMPLGARCLYMTMGMMADDDGFVNNAKTIIRMTGATEDDLKILVAKKFVIPFEDGVIVIKHWRINNYLRSDRHSETKYLNHKAELLIDEKGAYKKSDFGIPSSGIPVGIPAGIPSSGTPSIGKDRLGKDSIVEREERETPTPCRYGMYNNVILTDEERDALINDYPEEYQDMIENLSMYMKSTGKIYRDHYATMRKWKREDKAKVSDKPPKKGSKQELDEYYDMVRQWSQEDNDE